MLDNERKCRMQNAKGKMKEDFIALLQNRIVR